MDGCIGGKGSADVLAALCGRQVELAAGAAGALQQAGLQRKLPVRRGLAQVAQGRLREQRALVEGALAAEERHGDNGERQRADVFEGKDGAGQEQAERISEGGYAFKLHQVDRGAEVVVEREGGGADEARRLGEALGAELGPGVGSTVRLERLAADGADVIEAKSCEALQADVADRPGGRAKQRGGAEATVGGREKRAEGVEKTSMQRTVRIWSAEGLLLVLDGTGFGRGRCR